MNSKQVIARGAHPLPATMGVAYTTITGRGGQNERADERAHGRERGGRNRPTHRSGRSGKWRSRRSVDTGARRDPRATAATKKQRNAARHGRPERCVRSRLVLGRGFSAGPDAWLVAPGVWMAGLPVDSENPGRFDPYTRISSAPRTTCRWSLSRELVEKRRAVSPMAHLLGGGLGLADGLFAQREEHLAQRKAWFSGLAGCEIADRGLCASGGFRNLRLGPTLARLNFGDDGFPLHAPQNNVLPLFYQRISVIGFP